MVLDIVVLDITVNRHNIETIVLEIILREVTDECLVLDALGEKYYAYKFTHTVWNA